MTRKIALAFLLAMAFSPYARAGIDTPPTPITAGSGITVTNGIVSNTSPCVYQFCTGAAYGTVSVSTSPITIMTVTLDGQQALICGSDGTNSFCDSLEFNLANNIVISTVTSAGTPAARTYTNSGSGVNQLTMASGTYAVKVYGNVTGQR